MRTGRTPVAESLLLSMDHFDKICSFEGKRNAVLTLVFPPGNKVSTELASFIKRAKAIKHSSKRGQILKVLSFIEEKLEDVKSFDGNGKIICCGLGVADKISYFALEPGVAVTTVEYYYDYQFHAERIKELMNADILVTDSADHRFFLALQKLCLSNSPLLLLGDEVQECLAENPSCIEYVLQIGEHDISMSTIASLRDVSAQYRKVPLLKDNEDLRISSFADSWGTIFAVKRY